MGHDGKLVSESKGVWGLSAGTSSFSIGELRRVYDSMSGTESQGQGERRTAASGIASLIPDSDSESVTSTQDPIQSVISSESVVLTKRTNAALEQSLTTGIFVDTCFILFSRRAHDGTKLLSPMPIYAYSQSLIDAADYFQACELFL